MIKLVALDLDDTFLRSDKTIPASNKKALECVRNKGIQVCLVSGRGPESMFPYIRELGLSGFSHVAYAGVVRIQNDSSLKYLSLMKQSSYISLIEYLDCLGVEYLVKTKEDVIYKNEGPLMELFTFMNAENNYVKRDPKKACDVLKVMVSSGGDDEIRERMYNKKFDALSCYKGGDRYLDYMSSNANKYVAMMEIAGELGIEKNEILAVGDADIDREFIAGVKYGMCVANAVQNVKEAAYYISPLTNDENAVESILRKFVLSGAV